MPALGSLASAWPIIAVASSCLQLEFYPTLPQTLLQNGLMEKSTKRGRRSGAYYYSFGAGGWSRVGIKQGDLQLSGMPVISNYTMKT